MRYFLQQITESLDSGRYYVALFCSVGIPDICGAIDSEDGEANRDTYASWFDTYVGPGYDHFNGEDCYYFRCSLLHQGRIKHPKSSYTRILFAVPSGNTFHNNIIDDALQLDINCLCGDIVKGAMTWLQKVEKTARYKKNTELFLQYHPQGLSPYIVGVPVID